MIRFNTHSSQIAKLLFNYTSLFPYQSPLIKNNSIYKCCTILNGVIQQCQQFLAFLDPQNDQTTSTATNLQFSSKKLILHQPSSSTKGSTTSASKSALSSSTTSLTSKNTTKTVFKTTKSKQTKTTNTPPLSTSKFPKTNLFTYADKNIKLIQSSNDSLISQSNKLGNAEVGIIIACTGGVVVLSLMLILAMLCYKRHRYGAIYLSKSQKQYASSSQETISEVKSNSSTIENNVNIATLTTLNKTQDDSFQNTKSKKSSKYLTIFLIILVGNLIYFN